MQMNCTAKGEHVPEAERNNRTIGERIRATYHNLPCKAMPRVMLKYLAMQCTHQLNLFPAKGGVSAYFSPHVLLSGTNLDFNKHCQVPFGAYVQANQENTPTNAQAPRTIDAIYLRPMKNTQGGHELMNIATGLVITRNTVWELPVTDLVIQAIEAMAAEQNVLTLKLTGRNKVSLHPADWIAGVDYENATDNENANVNDEHNDEEHINEETNYDFDEEVDDEETYDRVKKMNLTT
jgi:hypothetical protein